MDETKKFCIHSDGLGYCDILSDDTVHHYCVEGPCPHEIIVEYEPVKHGRWIEHHNYFQGFYGNTDYKCSVCGLERDWLGGANYCPNCGAKMDGVEQIIGEGHNETKVWG